MKQMKQQNHCSIAPNSAKLTNTVTRLRRGSNPLHGPDRSPNNACATRAIEAAGNQ